MHGQRESSRSSSVSSVPVPIVPPMDVLKNRRASELVAQVVREHNSARTDDSDVWSVHSESHIIEKPAVLAVEKGTEAQAGTADAQATTEEATL